MGVLVELGRHAEAYDKITPAQEAFESSGGRVGVSGLCLARAHASIGLGRFDRAHSLLEKALALIDLTGRPMDEAEVHRGLGELWRAHPDPRPDAAEAVSHRALRVARAQLWRTQGRGQDAYDLLAPIYGWFTEGFGTRGLRVAKDLLEALR